MVCIKTGQNRAVTPKTKVKFAIYDPKALPKAISGFFATLLEQIL